MADPRRGVAEVAREVLAGARPGEEVEAYVARRRETDVKVFAGDVESVSSAEVAGVGIRVIVDGRQGYAWAGSLDADIVADTLVEARDNAAFSTRDEHAGLATREDAAGAVAALDLWRDAALAVGAADKVALALELERATLAADPRIRGVESSRYGDAFVEAAIATSTGIEALARRTVCSAAVFALAGEGEDTQTGYGYSVGRELADLDVGHAAREATERATRLLGARQPPSRRLPVILDPQVTAAFLGVASASLNGEAALKGRSIFAGREGESIASSSVTLLEDPTNPAAFGASTHDAEGIPTRRTELIHEGRLLGFLHNVYTGRRSGRGTTGSAVRGGFKSAPGVGARALHLSPGAMEPEGILASVDEALYVQSVSGLHSGANPVTGDFSVGAEGLMVRAGSFAEPVREVTVASTLQRMLHDIAGVGSDLTWLPGGAAGMTLLVSEMTLSGS